MANSSTHVWMRYIALAAIATIFIVVRVPGFALPYHQDEAKYALIATNAAAAEAFSGHPPLTEALVAATAKVFGAEGMRALPLVASALSLFLLYAVVRRMVGEEAALGAAFLYAITSYGVLASLMIDTDGAVLPLCFLAIVYAYIRAREESGRKQRVWIMALCVGIVVAFLVKLSAVLMVGAVCVDLLVRHRNALRPWVTLRTGVYAAAAAAGVTIVACAALAALPGYDIAQTLGHARSFIHFSGRGYGQVIIQCVKALLYLSPALIIPLVWARREDIFQMSVLWMYLLLGAAFYLVVFDFSQGALDKYLMYTIVPLSAISGGIVVRKLQEEEAASWWGMLLAAIVAVLPLLFLLVPHDILPLYPKSEWFSRVASGAWAIAIPFTGGSGPLGFYMSFLFAGVVWGISGLCALYAMYAPKARSFMVACIVSLSIVYNGVFTEELLTGRIFGDAPAALADALTYIQENEVPPVITHADAGSFDLMQKSKYAGRFYAVPGYEDGHRERFASHKGPYLVVDLPLFEKGGFYDRFFKACTVSFESAHGGVSARVYDCATIDPYDF